MKLAIVNTTEAATIPPMTLLVADFVGARRPQRQGGCRDFPPLA
jgi:hypothetical protein